MVRPDYVAACPDYGLFTACVSEFISTYVPVLSVGLDVRGGSPAGAWSIAASLIGMIYALGSSLGRTSTRR